MEPEMQSIMDQWGTPVIIALVVLAVLVVLAALVKRAIPKKARTPERVLAERDRAQREYDEERKRLTKMPKNIWREVPRDEIETQRARVDALRERVAMLDDELVQVRATSGGERR